MRANILMLHLSFCDLQEIAVCQPAPVSPSYALRAALGCAHRFVQQVALQILLLAGYKGASPSCTELPGVVFLLWMMRCVPHRAEEPADDQTRRRGSPWNPRRDTMKANGRRRSKDSPADDWEKRQDGGGSEGTCGPSEYFFGEYCETVER